MAEDSVLFTITSVQTWPNETLFSQIWFARASPGRRWSEGAVHCPSSAACLPPATENAMGTAMDVSYPPLGTCQGCSKVPVAVCNGVIGVNFHKRQLWGHQASVGAKCRSWKEADPTAVPERLEKRVHLVHLGTGCPIKWPLLSASTFHTHFHTRRFLASLSLDLAPPQDGQKEKLARFLAPVTSAIHLPLLHFLFFLSHFRAEKLCIY